MEHDERTCLQEGCGRVAVPRYGRCLEHMSSPAITARESECRAEIRATAAAAQAKMEAGEALTAREAEVLESERLIQERFHGAYPPPAPRGGITWVDASGNIVDPRELSEHFRVARDRDENIFGNLLQHGVVAV